ncbi:MAG: T9SS C-terminal target domain-containing protein, partial [Bacteroidetes bacterium]|nr:T9SS C-terminal target domain-containing protein [Bacteroidota bacterium]
QGNDLYMSWFTLANCTVAPGTPLFRVDAQGEVEGVLMVGSQTELANDWAEPLAQHGLRAPRFVKSNFDGVSVYPNPTRDRAVITSESNINLVEVLDVTGRVLHTSSASSMSVSIDMNAFPAGQYLVRVSTDAGIQTERIVRY